MKVFAVIPARLASTRLPEKILLKDTGKYLVQHVYEQAQKAQKITKTIIATDSPEIITAVASFGGEAQITSKDHQSGTDRIAEIAKREPADVFVNVQGDEPEISPKDIDNVASLLIENPEADIATLCYSINQKTAMNPNVVKVVIDNNDFALYFSRSPIPYIRDGKQNKDNVYLGHVGIYAYRRSFLLKYTSLHTSFLENLEKLEQLRALENKYKIIVGKTKNKTRGIDTIEDYKSFVGRYQKQCKN